MTKATELKKKIADILEGLRRREVVGTVLVREVNESLFDMDIPKYPAAILPPPYITAEVITNSENLRTYTFELLIIQKQENVTDTNPVEDLMESIIDEFDNYPSLDGTAEGGLEPATSPTETFTTRGKSFTLFRVILKAKASKAITL